MSRGESPAEAPVNFTPRAAERVKEFMARQGTPSLGVRVRAEEDECGCLIYSLRLQDEPVEGDAVFTTYDLKVFVDPATAEAVRGATVDYMRTPETEGFKISGGACGAECDCS